MGNSLDAGVMHTYGLKLNKLVELTDNGILPFKVKELVKEWGDKLGKNALYTEERGMIDRLHDDGLIREKQEAIRVQNNVR